MACGLHPQDCLTDHVLPSVAEARQGSRAGQYRGLCPVCSRATLSMSVGKSARIVWTCHAGCTQPAVREGLISAGVSERCLPRMVAQEGSRAGQRQPARIDPAAITELALSAMPPMSLKLALLELAGMSTSEALDKLGVRREHRARVMNGRAPILVQNRRS